VTPQDLEPRILSIATSRMLRVKQVGVVYFIENLSYHRRIDEDGNEQVDEQWKVVATAKGKDAHKEAHLWLAEANMEIIHMIATRPVARA
jgi:hypothetical protein